MNRLGLKRAELENTVQDDDDRIDEGRAVHAPWGTA
jgi:hypothetical protein